LDLGHGVDLVLRKLKLTRQNGLKGGLRNIVV